MEIKGKVHCLFEQSGAFKREFVKLGFNAADYDLKNDFGETDFIVDLFEAIDNFYNGKPCIFDHFTLDDLSIAFFPCIYFNQNNFLFFTGYHNVYRNKTKKQICDIIIDRGRNRQFYYEILLKFFTMFDKNGLRLIVENPWVSPHFLQNNFPYKPSLIDRNRQLRGDTFKKPTQYWFINCKPRFGSSYTKPEIKMNIDHIPGKGGSGGTVERSMISSSYARNFICDFILGKELEYSEKTLFDF